MLKLINTIMRSLTGTKVPAPAPATIALSRKPAVPVKRPAKPVMPAVKPQTVVLHDRSAPTVHQADRIGLVGFHRQGFVIARPAGPLSPWLLERSQKLHDLVGGTTNITAGLQRALELLQPVSRGIYRKIWLLSDGAPNEETALLFPTVRACYEAHVNIHTIGFGDQFDAELLCRIAQSTHNGRFVSVGSLRELTRALVQSDYAPTHRALRRSEVTILAIDLSASMREPMEGRTKIEVVEEAIRHLIHYKQKLFS
jgi:Mg-chelatase subunit ChlD